MFDISFGELVVIGTVALVVIGPEKLPKIARTAGMLFGRAQRMAAGFRADLERELRDSEVAQLQKDMNEAASKLQDEMAESAAGVTAALADQPPSIPADVPSILPPAVVETAEPPAPKARRTAKVANAEAASTPASTPASASAEAEAAPAKKPRKRKVAEPQSDLFAAPVPATLPDEKDRR